MAQMEDETEPPELLPFKSPTTAEGGQQRPRAWSVSILAPSSKLGNGSEDWRFDWAWKDWLPSLPLLTWLPKLVRNPKALTSDVVAGLTVATMMVPQGMAYASAMGLPPVYGLFSGFIPPIVYGLLGSSMHLSIGPVALVSLNNRAVLGALGVPDPAAEPLRATQLSISIAFMVACTLLVMGLLRLGNITRLVSHAVLTGFTNAAAITIGLSQLDNILGFSIPLTEYTYQEVVYILEHVKDTKWYTALLGLLCLAMLLLSSSAKTYLDQRKSIWSKRLKYVFPLSNLVVVIVATVVAKAMVSRGIPLHIVGDVPKGLPSVMVPSMEHAGLILEHSLSVVLLAFIEAVAVAKKYAALGNTQLDVNQELLALGASNLVGSFFSCHAVSGSFGRTAVAFSSGALTPFANIVLGSAILVVLLWLTPLFYYVPRAALGAIVMVALCKLLDLKAFVEEYHRSKLDFSVMLLTFLATICLNSQLGLGIGVVASLPVFFLSTYGRAMVFQYYVRPHFVRALTPNLDVVVISAQRFLAARSPARRRLPEYLVTCRGVEARNRYLWVVLNGQSFPDRPLTVKESKRLHGLVRDVNSLKLCYQEERAVVLIVGLNWVEDEAWSPLIGQGCVVYCSTLLEVLEEARRRDREELIMPAPFAAPSLLRHPYSFTHMRAPKVEDVKKLLGSDEGVGEEEEEEEESPRPRIHP